MNPTGSKRATLHFFFSLLSRLYVFLSPPIAHAYCIHTHGSCSAAGSFFIMKPYATSFYKSKQWKDCRKAYASSKRYLCERCLAKGIYKHGDIVHHKIYITPDNITNPMITLDWNNLELVCRDCHAEEHLGNTRRVTVDEAGRVLFNTPPV